MARRGRLGKRSPQLRFYPAQRGNRGPGVRIHAAPPAPSPDGRYGLPAPVHPIPLLRMAQHQSLERHVVRARIDRDRFTRVGRLDRRHRRFEAQHMATVGLAPARRGHDRRARGERNDREALERPRRLIEEAGLDAVRRARMLVERKDDHVAALQHREHRVERSALARGRRTRRSRSAGSRSRRAISASLRAARNGTARALRDSCRCRRWSRPPSCRNGR